MKFLCSSELIPSVNQKSFYGKAKVETWIKDNKNIFILKSYCTDILVIYKDKLYRASDTYEGDFFLHDFKTLSFICKSIYY